MVLKIVRSEFITSAPNLKACPEWELPEIAMVGRSNVGKSSLINRLVGRKNIAKTSNTPGKTRLINFYQINETFALVDLPGYGYAKVSKSMQQEWQRHLEAYLQKRENLILVIQLIDVRHGPQPNDEAMLSWLESKEIPVIVVLTKIDKISRNDVSKQIALSAKKLKLKQDQLFPFSAESGYGKEPLLAFLENYMAAAAEGRGGE